MACTSGCRTKDHSSYGECLKAKNPQKIYADEGTGHDLTAEKKFHQRLDLYEKARREGIQPPNTQLESTQAAIALSDKTGTAFRAD